MQKHNAMLTPFVSPLGSERFGEMMCAAVGVRRAQRKPGRPTVKRDHSERVEDQSEFGF